MTYYRWNFDDVSRLSDLCRGISDR